MRVVKLLLILCAAAVAVIAFYEKYERTSLAESQRTLATRLAAKGLRQGQPVFVRIFKQEAVLELWMRDDKAWRLFQSYPICRFSGGLGPKLRQGDRQAPEGFYQVTSEQLNPNSRHHLSFNLGFPNAFDRVHGRTGSYLMVHGGCSSIGCYAMTDPAVDDIYRLLSGGTRNHAGLISGAISRRDMTCSRATGMFRASNWSASVMSSRGNGRQAVSHTLKEIVNFAAEQLNSGKDDKEYAGCKEGIFNGGRTFLIVEKARQPSDGQLHCTLRAFPCDEA